MQDHPYLNQVSVVEQNCMVQTVKGIFLVELQAPQNCSKYNLWVQSLSTGFNCNNGQSSSRMCWLRKNSIQSTEALAAERCESFLLRDYFSTYLLFPILSVEVIFTPFFAPQANLKAKKIRVILLAVSLVWLRCGSWSQLSNLTQHLTRIFFCILPEADTVFEDQI